MQRPVIVIWTLVRSSLRTGSRRPNRKRVGTNTLRRGAGVCWTWDMDMPDLPVIGKRCSRPGTPTR